MKDLYVSWDEYNRLVEKLALKVYDSGWNFDAIVCLARGGLRVGDVLSRLFDRPLGVLFTSSYREEEGTRQSRLMIGEHLSSAEPLPGPRWLLVDVRFKRKLKRPITLKELKDHPRLGDFQLNRRGNRLSVFPVSKNDWDLILSLE